ncbi:ATP-binding protein [Rhizobiaceae bacterium BDR2-2]|uniref:histidine kinase n=1 Tax=Ectorhizobium quercum TaxID=2965071 RepID=A0AAE3MWT4_9HYPH|nr:ATP-binding protein [Ectorhizobium quercum]MCX8995772.1 ATP-binding protein [Ectorhizobium quercum]
MSDLTRLKNRISDAFGASPEKGEGSSGRVALTPPSLSADAAFDTVNEVLRAERRRSFRPGSYLLGAAGLLACAVALAVGRDAGLYAVIGGLGSGSAAAALFHLLSRAPAAASPGPVPAARQDAMWYFGESAVIHDTLGDILLTRDAEGRILSANARFRSLVGDAAPEGRTCGELGLVFEPAGKPGRFEVGIATGRGPRMFLWHDVMGRDAAGRPVVQSLARDVTDEHQLARAREEARLRAEEASEAKSRLLATVSHEIRTPLGGILGMVSLLSRTRLTPEQVNYLEGIRQSGEALGQLVDELLDCASIEAGRFSVNPVVTGMRPFVEGVSEMLAHRAHAKGLEIAVTVTADVPERLEFDSARVRQVLFNVIGNAVKFTRTGGVLVSAAMDRSEIVMTVRDTGPGMGEAELSSIFEEFEQVGEARDRSGGTGLGLSISARIMTALGGSLSAASRKGEGSIFTIRFPVEVPAGEVGAGNGHPLEESRVLLLAPAGPAARATVATLETLGALCRHVTSASQAARALGGASSARASFTDIIVDHRLSASFARAVPARREGETGGPRRIFLVNPEERTARRRGDYDAWLIRPLREKTLTDVLTGRMSGVEKRDARNDNRPLPGFASTLPDDGTMSGLDILLAEDDPINAMLARSALEKAGHNVSHVSDFEAVLSVMTDRHAARPDLLVTDLSMPGGEGLEIIGRIRDTERQDGLARVPILVLTADKRRQSAQRALANGADGILEKPAVPEMLLEEVAILCGLAGAQKAGG